MNIKIDNNPKDFLMLNLNHNEGKIKIAIVINVKPIVKLLDSLEYEL